MKEDTAIVTSPQQEKGGVEYLQNISPDEDWDLNSFKWPANVNSDHDKISHLWYLYANAEVERKAALSVLQASLSQQQNDSSEIENLVRRLNSAIEQFEGDAQEPEVGLDSARSEVSSEIKNKIDTVVSQQMSDLIAENNTLQRTLARMLASAPQNQQSAINNSEIAALQAELVAGNERYCKLLSTFSRDKSQLESQVARLESAKRREVWQLNHELAEARSTVESLRASVDALKKQNARLLAVAKGEK